MSEDVWNWNSVRLTHHHLLTHKNIFVWNRFLHQQQQQHCNHLMFSNENENNDVKIIIHLNITDHITIAIPVQKMAVRYNEIDFYFNYAALISWSLQICFQWLTLWCIKCLPVAVPVLSACSSRRPCQSWMRTIHAMSFVESVSLSIGHTFTSSTTSMSPALTTLTSLWSPSSLWTGTFHAHSDKNRFVCGELSKKILVFQLLYRCVCYDSNHLGKSNPWKNVSINLSAFINSHRNFDTYC